MAKHVWTVLCRRGVVDQFDNTVSMFDTVETVTFETEKELPPSNAWTRIQFEVMLISFVVRTNSAIPEQSHLKIEVSSPDGNVYDEAAPMIVNVDLKEYVKSRQFTRMRSLPIRGTGEHWFHIFLEQADGSWERVAQIPLGVEGKVREQIGPKETGEKTAPKKRRATKAKAS